MQQRIDAMKVAPGAYKAMAGLQSYVDQSGLERSLLELVKIRTSQINGCAFCLVMHTNEARKHFSEKELVDLTLAIVTINGWNRISIATRAQPHVKSAKAA